MEFLNIDIIMLQNLKEQLKNCVDKKEWFEINENYAEVLYNYINSIEKSYENLYEELQYERRKKEVK